MKNRLKLALGVILFLCVSINGILAQKTYKYETVPNDPLKARIYTLDNGLKVFLTEYKDAPRIQSYVAVKVGSKNDPSETTGLAHYFEHMMFKGTPNFGTLNWEKEKVLIDAIEKLFEIYRVEKDDATRATIYKQIDSLSYEASKLAIPNEYVKLMKAIGSQGTNAGTSNDYTTYIENIPSNQLRNWALIQADRFEYNVLRLFHTELETVYEEKNMSLTNDGRKANEAMMKLLYPNHPYGKQTTLGDAEHLKNPSMKNIREFFAKYYVPNNMAVVLSGDFNSDEAIKIIDETFGRLKPSPVSPLTYTKEAPITQPIVKDVVGLDAENMRIAFRFNGAGTKDALMIKMISEILSNNKAGIIDLNINQKQLALSASAYTYILNDYSSLVLSARPKTNQTLEELKVLLLEQIEKLKKGDFPDWMLEAAINNLKLQELKRYESNNGRGMAMVNAYLNNISWEKQVNYIFELSKITKAELVAFANENFKDNYVVVNKRQGKPEDVKKVSKPAITPIFINRDAESDFLKKVKASTIKDIQPKFLDYTKDIKRIKTQNNIEILYTQNTENKTFNLIYYFKMGDYNDKKFDIAINYLPYLGSSKHTAEEIQQEFFKLACSFYVSSSNDNTYISISGLSENMEKAIALVEEVLSSPKADKSALDNLVNDILKSRNDRKGNQQSNFNALLSYATFGSNSPEKYMLSEKELKAITPEELIVIIKDLTSYQHSILFYGPDKIEQVQTVLNKYHKVPAKLKTPKLAVKFEEQNTDKNRVYFAQYEAKQSFLQQVIKGGKYDKNQSSIISLFNSYFGGSMNAIVFQELREKRSLAYSTRASFATPDDNTKNYINNSYIATQNDKVIDAFDAYNELYNKMPQIDINFNLAKEAILTKIKTERITKMNIIWDFLDSQKMGLNSDIRQEIYTKIPSLTLNDVVVFVNTYLKDKTKTYVILGNEKDLDFKALEKYGEVIKLSKEDIFGY